MIRLLTLSGASLLMWHVIRSSPPQGCTLCLTAQDGFLIGLRRLIDNIFAGPDKKLKLSLNYPASVGRNMDEIVRCVDALQLSAKYSVATPANCKSLLCWVCTTSCPDLAFRVTLPRGDGIE